MTDRAPADVPARVVSGWMWWTGFFAMVALALLMTQRAYAEGLPVFLSRIPASDKVLHFSTAGLLAFFLDGALRRRVLYTIGRLAIPLAAAGVLVPAGIDEYLQRFSEVRTSSIWDFAADVAGVAVLIPLSRRFAK
jgi:VanZ family protein